MGKDEELLLANLEKDSGSDSDEVVEEFKLPPPRVRRKRKPLPDGRGGSSLITWKCCFSFIVISILLSGGLVLAFFIYNMYTQLNNLKQQVEFYRGNSNTFFSKHEQKINELESRHSDVLSFRTTQDSMINKLDVLNKTVHKMKGTKSDDSGDFERQIGNIKRDIQTLQSSSAKAQATFSSTQQMLLRTVQQLKKDVQEMKVESLNPTNTNTNGGGSIPGGETTSGDYMTKQEVNELLKKFSSHFIDSQSASSKETVDQLSNLNAAYHSLNITHNKDLLRLARNIISLKESFNIFQSEFTTKYQPVIIDLRKAARDVFHQLRFHNNTFDALRETIQKLNEDLKALKESHRNSMTIPIPLTGITGKTTAKPTTVPSVVDTATESPQHVEPTASVTSATTASSGIVNNNLDADNKTVGPMLPDERNMHVINETSVNTTRTPSHIFSGIPTQVYEQTAKNESESQYSKFKSAKTSAPVNMPPTTSSSDSVQADGKRGDTRDTQSDEKDYSSLLSNPKNLNPYDDSRSNPDTDDRRDYQRGDYQSQGGRDYQPQGNYPGTGDQTYQPAKIPSQGDSPYNQGGRSEGGDTGGSKSTKKMARVLKLLRSNRLSENQRREIMQRLLEKEGPRYDGD